MSYNSIELTHPVEKVVRVVLNRPRRFNALNRQTIQELQEAIESFQSSEDQFFILTGAGRAFCYGADFEEFENRDALQDLLFLFQSLIRKLYYCPKITVCSLNGFATGAGLDLALACDFRIAAAQVKLAEAYISMGLVPDGGGTFFLPRLIGPGRALEMLMLGQPIGAEEAFRIGLVHRVFPAEELAGQTLKLVEELSVKPQTAIRLIKNLVKNQPSDLDVVLAKELEAQTICFQDPEHIRLTETFLKKRKEIKK